MSSQNEELCKNFNILHTIIYTVHYVLDHMTVTTLIFVSFVVIAWHFRCGAAQKLDRQHRIEVVEADEDSLDVYMRNCLLWYLCRGGTIVQ